MLDQLLIPADRAFQALNREERVAAFTELMRSWGDDSAVAEIAEAAILALRHGAPPPIFQSVYDEAEAWAEFAAPGELRAFCWSTGKRLRPDQRAGLIKALLALDTEAA